MRPTSMRGRQQAAVFDHLYEEIALSFHRAYYCFTQPPGIEPTSFTQRVACSQRALGK